MTERLAIDISGVSVMLGMPVAPKSGLPPKTAMSLVATAKELTERGIDYGLTMKVSGLVTVCRDMVLDAFLKSGKQKLFWLDSDMVWTPGDFLRLLAHSTRFDAVCAAYPAKVEKPDTFYMQNEATLTINDHGLLPIRGTGLGFCIVDRSICERLAGNAPKVTDQVTGETVASVFRVDSHEGTRRSEDFAFFHDIETMGTQLWLDPSINLGHIGEKEWRGNLLNVFHPAA